MSHIIIYTKTGCPWCRDALSYLREKHLPFEEREVLGNPVFFQELEQKTGQRKTPTLDVEGRILADTDKDAIDAWFRTLGIVE